MWRWDQTEPFGNNVPDENPSGLGAFEFPLRFPGQYADKETNLHYNYYRNYDSALGRYVESDLIGLEGGLATYLYAGAAPLVYIDPLGLIQIYEVDGVSFHAYAGPPAGPGNREHARHGPGESYHVHVKTPDGKEVRYSSETWKPLTPDEEAKDTKKHRETVKSLTAGEKKLLYRMNREVFHTGRPTIQQLMRIGVARGARAGVVCRPSQE